MLCACELVAISRRQHLLRVRCSEQITGSNHALWLPVQHSTLGCTPVRLRSLQFVNMRVVAGAPFWIKVQLRFDPRSMSMESCSITSQLPPLVLGLALELALATAAALQPRCLLRLLDTAAGHPERPAGRTTCTQPG